MISEKTNFLQSIIGWEVVDAHLIPDDAGFTLKNGASIAIYNKFELTGKCVSGNFDLVGDVIENTEEAAEFIVIHFRSGRSIKVDMRNEAYRGPEALQLRLPEGPIVIWN